MKTYVIKGQNVHKLLHFYNYYKMPSIFNKNRL